MAGHGQRERPGNVLQEQGPRAFSSHSERVYGTAIPPRSGAVMRSLTDHQSSSAEHSPRTPNAPNTESGPRTFPA
jgi:hypothetical protein